MATRGIGAISLGCMSERRFGVVSRLWPELLVLCSWLALFTLDQVAFRDDESLAHHATHLGLWVAVVVYLGAAVRQHRLDG